MASLINASPLAMLHAAAVALDLQHPLPHPPHTTMQTPESHLRNLQPLPSPIHCLNPTPTTSHSSSVPLCDLLNPAPSNISTPLPPGFVIGKDGKIKKKRGRKPTPGLTDEDRRQARLLKNRRTAETSRRRKLALLNKLKAERDEAKLVAEQLRKHNEYLTARLAKALGSSVDKLLKNEPSLALKTVPRVEPDHSDVSRPQSVADSDSDSGAKKS